MYSLCEKYSVCHTHLLLNNNRRTQSQDLTINLKVQRCVSRTLNLDFFTDHVAAWQATPNLMASNVTADFVLYYIPACSCWCMQLSGTRRLNPSRRDFLLSCCRGDGSNRLLQGSTHWAGDFDYTSSTFPPAHLALPGNKQSITRRWWKE